MAWNKRIQTPVVADNGMEQTHSDNCRGRFIVPTADLSALIGINLRCPRSFTLSRSEGSVSLGVEMLRSTQHDRALILPPVSLHGLG
jgi:hypothetical protein